MPFDSLLADGKGGFWLGGQTALVHWRGGASEVYPIPALKSHVGQPGITSLARGPDGSLWVGIGAEGPGLGLCQFKEGIVKPFVTPTFDGSRLEVFSTIFDRDGNLWVASLGKGVFRIRGNVVEHYQHTDGLSGDSVTVLFEDREGNMWAAATSGIDSFRTPLVTTFSATEGLPKDGAVGVLASRDGTIWVASDDSLDHIDKNGTVSSIRTGSGLPGHQVAALLEDHSGNLWVGVDDGLYVLKDGHFRRVAEPDHQPMGMVLALAEDTGGNIWAECASSPRKLVAIWDFEVREVFPESQIPAGRTLAPDPRGGIWISTLKGDLALFRNGVLETQFPLNPGDLTNRQIIAKADGSVLAGSKNGLVGWRAGKVQRMTMKNGLPCEAIISFIEDTDKRWWLNTRCGIIELSDSELQRWWADPEAVLQTKVYDALDGARPATPPFNSAAVSSDGRVWFATSTVVQMVDPSSISQKALPPQTYIESLVADRKRFEATPSLKLPPNPKDLQIDYTSPTFSIPQKVKFRYRLDRYDRDWHEAGTRRQAFYTDLPPGKYVFRVKASNSDGVWNENAASLEFSVAPAYYQTNWFRVLCGSLFLALLWAIYQWRVRQLQKQFDITLDARVSERTRVARDLHDTLLQSFQGLLPLIQAGIIKLPDGAVESRETLESVLDRASEAIGEGRDAIKGLRMSTMEKNDLAMAIRTIGEELAAAEKRQKFVSFELLVEGTPRELHPIVRDEIYRLATEALRNSFRHADAKKVEVEIRYDEKYLRLRVRDDGKGIPSDVLSRDSREGHYGLPGMRERAALVGGKLTIWTEMDSGTEIELVIPGAKVYMKSTRRFWPFGTRSATQTNETERIGRE